LKNVSRPRNRFVNEKNSQLSAKQNSSMTKPSTSSKDNLPNLKDFQTNEIRNIFNDEYFKSANVSQFALALVQALRHVGQTTKMYEINRLRLHIFYIFCLEHNKTQI
jgi:hypothetical protein